MALNTAELKDADGLSLAQCEPHTYRIKDTYGNQQKVKFLVKTAEITDPATGAVNTTGSFLSDGEKECTVGYSVDLQFTVNKSLYKFNGLEAVSSADPSVKHNDVVTFTELESNDDTGTYKIRATISEALADILIQPVCTLLPKIAEITPAFDSAGCDQDTPVRITFNKAVNTESFGDFSCVSVYSSSGSLAAYFGTPYFTDDCRTLCIPPKPGVLILMPDSNQKMDITVAVSMSGKKDIDGLEIAQGEPYTYRIKDTYGNQQKITFLVKTIDGTGTFLSDGEKSCSVGYSVDLQFTVNKDSYKFIGLEAVSSADPSTSRGTAVTFAEPSETSPGSGTYKIRTTINTAASDILIRPKCILLPKVAEITPAFETAGCDQDTPIKITFNKPVSPESFGDFSCVSVYSQVGSLAAYFDTPYFASDKKTLYVPPKEGVHILTPDSNQKLDVTLSLDLKGKTDADGIAISQNEPYTYRIKDTYGNQERVTFTVRTITGTGTFLSDGEKTCTVGYSVDLQFTANQDDYKFKGLEAVCSTNPADTERNAIVSAAVSFKTIESNPNTGVYKIRATVSQNLPDILIRPKCLLLPAVLTHTPNTDTSPAAANIPIVITFNMPAEDKSTTSFSSLFNYTNISLKNGNTSITEYFEPPVFNSDKNVLTLQPKSTQLKALITSAFMDVQVSFSQNIKIPNAGDLFSLKQNDNSNFTVRYKPETETTAPEKYEFFATAKETSLATADSAQNKFTQEALANFGDTEILKNRTSGTIWIYGRYYDNESGVKTVRLTEQKTNDKDGTAVTTTTRTHEFTSTSNNAEFTNDGNGNTTFCIKYDLESDDGAILIGVTVLDACTNAAPEQTFTAIKDSGIDLSGVELYNTDWNPFALDLFFTRDGTYGHQLITEDEYTEKLRAIKLNYLNKQVYKNCNAVESNLTVSLTYNGNTRNMSLDSTKNRWTHTLENITDTSGLSLTLKVTDDLGNSTTKAFNFPKKPKCVFLQDDEAWNLVFPQSDNYIASLGNDSNDFDKIFVVPSEKDDEKSLTSYNYSSSCNLSTLKDSPKSYKFMPLKGSLFGELSDEISTANVNQKTLTPVKVKDAKLIYNMNDNNICAEITMDTSEGNPWDTYNSIFAQYATNSKYDLEEYHPNNDQPTSQAELEKNATSITFKINLVYKQKVYVRLIGKRGNELSHDAEYGTTDSPSSWYYVCNPSDSPKNDLIPPQKEEEGYLIASYNNTLEYLDSRYPVNPTSLADWDFNRIVELYDYIIPVFVYDTESGVKKIEITTNDVKWIHTDSILQRFNFNLKGYSYACPPNWDVDKELNSLSIKYYDGNNNCFEWSGTFISAKIPSFSMQSGSLVSEEYNDGTLYCWRLGIDRFDASTNSWNYRTEINTDTEPTQSAGTNGGKVYTYSSSSLSLPADTFVRITATAALENTYNTTNFGNSAPYIYYTGSTKNTGTYDYVIANGRDKTSVLVASDAPTFVHTLITKHPLADCENWSVAEWEHKHKHTGDKYMDFTSNTTAQKYTIPVSKIEKGDCYVVIAHFADGTTAMSEVMRK